MPLSQLEGMVYPQQTASDIPHVLNSHLSSEKDAHGFERKPISEIRDSHGKNHLEPVMGAGTDEHEQKLPPQEVRGHGEEQATTNSSSRNTMGGCKQDVFDAIEQAIHENCRDNKRRCLPAFSAANRWTAIRNSKAAMLEVATGAWDAFSIATTDDDMEGQACSPHPSLSSGGQAGGEYEMSDTEDNCTDLVMFDASASESKHEALLRKIKSKLPQ